MVGTAVSGVIAAGVLAGCGDTDAPATAGPGAGSGSASGLHGAVLDERYDAADVTLTDSSGDPFAVRLVRWLEGRVQKVLDSAQPDEYAVEGKKPQVHTDRCIVCMEGPQFSTRAESKMYRMWGGDVINMSVLPEAKLAREAELGYVHTVYCGIRSTHCSLSLGTP